MNDTKYNFTYCPFDIDYTEELAGQMLQEVLALDSEYWHFNEFRNCYMLSFYNPGGRVGRYELGRNGQQFIFSPAAYHCPTLKKFTEEQVLTFMSPHGRITILRTPAGNKLPVHIDCAREEAGTIQHKWRFVLQGDVDKLHFLDRDLNSHSVGSSTRCYVLDGGHPHHLLVSETEKITICIGSPWHGDITDHKYTERLLLDRAIYMSRPDTIPDHWIEQHLLKK